jgi:hypothetical protein
MDDSLVEVRHAVISQIALAHWAAQNQAFIRDDDPNRRSLPSRHLLAAGDGSVEEAYRMAGAPDGVVAVSLWVRWMDRFAWSKISSFLLFSTEGGSATPSFFSAFRVAIPLSGTPELLRVVPGWAAVLFGLVPCAPDARPSATPAVPVDPAPVDGAVGLPLLAATPGALPEATPGVPAAPVVPDDGCVVPG